MSDKTPRTPFEALFGIPAPAAGPRVDPMHFDSVGKHCDFCPAGSDPAVWAYPCGEATRSIDIGDTGRTMDFPVQAGLWYACERCHRYIKGGGWAALAKNLGYPEGHAGDPAWQAFRVARLKGPGYAWPLVDAKTPEVYPAAVAAWRETVAEYDGAPRAALDAVHLVTVLLGTLYARTASEEQVLYLRDEVGPELMPRFHARLGHEMRLALYADLSAR